ncbi:TRAP transporter small permease [Roseicyclus mahoneyensis]|uniref:TRAP transporter small permease protein n=1 Tax=Roseicyclus mahoneyensis TaxID=164332 RepID=A0A316GMR5_9RHOB|nr:TRAP transporter small permease subunit [Roseicyclus mahoneyensis]PWK62325.1 tripartite ATP-independent transporter DctQ subunit [Roseicyclus mahoneyensis]
MLHLVTRLARMMALMGGLVLTALVGLTCLSVLGRGLDRLGHAEGLMGFAPGLAAFLTGFGPVRGDYELVEAGIAFAVFAFLPICQLSAGHASVDLFTGMMSDRVNRFLIAFWEVVLAVVIVVIGWRLFMGFIEKIDNGQTTFLLQFPVWWAYGASFVAAAVAGLVGIYCALARVVEGLTGRSYLPDDGRAEH